MTDPCPDTILSFADSSITDQTYFLRDEPLILEWTNESLIHKETLVYCGPLVIEMFYDNGSEFDTEIFNLEKLADSIAFITLATQDLTL